MCHQLDVKTGELNQTRRDLENQHSVFAETRQNLSLVSGKEEGLSKRLDEREAELSELHT